LETRTHDFFRTKSFRIFRKATWQNIAKIANLLGVGGAANYRFGSRCALRVGRGAAHAAHNENGGYYDDDSAASDDRRDDAGSESSFAAVGRCLLLLSCLAVVGVG